MNDVDVSVNLMFTMMAFKLIKFSQLEEVARSISHAKKTKRRRGRSNKVI